MEKRDPDPDEMPHRYRMPAEMQAQYDKRMAEIRAAEREKYPQLRRPDKGRDENS